MLGNLQDIDTILFLVINQSFSHRILDRFFLIITEPIYYIVPVIIVLLYFINIDWRKTLVVLLLSTATLALTDTICDEVLKPVFDRTRPCHPDLMVEGARCIGGLKSSYSFPSAHAMNIFAQATLFAFLYPGKSIYFFVFAGIIGLSRIYIGVHYPLDVISRALAGGIIAAGVFAAYFSIKKRFQSAPT